MFSNSRKTIGVFLERSESEFQNELCKGVMTKAEELGYNVAVFSAYGNYGENEKYFVGDQTLWELPPYEELDGVIMLLDTIVCKSGREKILSDVKARCKCPIVSVREVVKGANNLLVDNKTCMDGIIDHFILDHGLKRICFMTGPKEHWDAVERLDCFFRKMKEHNLPVDEHQYFWGDYWKGKGKEACDWFLQGEERPEAIVCASDHMAMAVASELNGRGFRIPEDISVSGYDGLKGTLSFTPSMTTVMVPFFEMGQKSVEIIEKRQNNPKNVKDYYFDAVVKKRETCGCMTTGGRETLNIRQRLYDIQNQDQNREMQFHFMSMHLSECHTVEEVSERITYYAYNIPGFRDYAVCLCENILENDNLSTYTDTMELRIVIKERDGKGHVCMPFDRTELLPEMMTGEEPQMWYFAPIHFQDNCFGYEALRFYDFETTGKLYLHWNIVMGNQIQNIITYQKMQRLMNQLEDMYDKDALTAIYNRRGFENYATPMFEDAKANGDPIFFLIIDMDGMKQINDNYGHVEGDFALKKISKAISKAFPKDVIVARTGGDEFVVVAKDIDEKQGSICMGKVERYLDSFNSTKQKEYDIHASFGAVYRVPKKRDTLQHFMKESDEVMYINKVTNKTKRGEVLR